MNDNFVKGFLVGVLATLAIGYIKRTLDGGHGQLPVIEYNGNNPPNVVQPNPKQ